MKIQDFINKNRLSYKDKSEILREFNTYYDEVDTHKYLSFVMDLQCYIMRETISLGEVIGYYIYTYKDKIAFTTKQDYKKSRIIFEWYDLKTFDEIRQIIEDMKIHTPIQFIDMEQEYDFYTSYNEDTGEINEIKY